MSNRTRSQRRQSRFCHLRNVAFDFQSTAYAKDWQGGDGRLVQAMYDAAKKASARAIAARPWWLATWKVPGEK